MITSIINPYKYQDYYNNNELISDPFIISLDKDTDKYHNATQILENLHLQPMKFHAIDGKELKNTRPDICDKFTYLNDGEMGCFISHYLIYYLASQHSNPDQYTMIFEDDIGTEIDSKSFNDKLKDSVNHNPDLIYLGKCAEFCIMIKQIHDDLYQGYKPLCMHAYMIKNSFAKRVVESINKLEIIDTPIDKIIFKTINGTKILEYHPSLFYQDPKYPSNLRGTVLQIANELECLDLPNLPKKLIKVHQNKVNWMLIIILIIALIIYLYVMS